MFSLDCFSKSFIRGEQFLPPHEPLPAPVAFWTSFIVEAPFLIASLIFNLGITLQVQVLLIYLKLLHSNYFP